MPVPDPHFSAPTKEVQPPAKGILSRTLTPSAARPKRLDLDWPNYTK
jgi:hypothetical protein